MKGFGIDRTYMEVRLCFCGVHSTLYVHECSLRPGKWGHQKLCKFSRKLRKYLAPILMHQCKCVFILYFFSFCNNFRRDMFASWSLWGMDAFASAVLCGNSVATRTQYRRLWIWIWMGNFISTARMRNSDANKNRMSMPRAVS